MFLLYKNILTYYIFSKRKATKPFIKTFIYFSVSDFHNTNTNASAQEATMASYEMKTLIS